MANKEKFKDRNTNLAKSIRYLVEQEIKSQFKKSIKQRQVVIKKIYNADNLNTRRVDISFTDDISESISIKNIPVNIPQNINIGDYAYLFYFGDNVNNGWIGQLITNSSVKGINADTVDGLHLKKISEYEYNQLKANGNTEANVLYIILD